MRSFKFKPVAWLTTLAVMIAAVIQVNAEYQLLPEGWMRWLMALGGLVALVLTGIKTYDSVTPLADPHDSTGAPLVRKYN